MSGSADVSPSPVSLHGAETAYFGAGALKHPQVMQIRLHKSIFKSLLESINSNQPPHVIFGSTPALEIDGQNIPLVSIPDRFRNEVYRYTEEDPKNWKFEGLQSHTLSVASKKKADPSLEALKNSLAQSDLEKQANATLRVDAHTGRRPGTTTLPAYPSSTLLLPRSAPPVSTPIPAAITAQAARRKGMMAGVRNAIIHLLAARISMSASELRKTLSIPDTADSDFFMVPLKSVAVPTKPDSEAPWKLKDKSFRDLLPWKFSYESDEVREAAVEHAIKAYDRLRIPPSDLIWQNLLPEDERNKGRVLSRLQLRLEKTIEEASTPARPIIDRNTGLPRQQKKKPVTEKDKDKEKEKDKDKEKSKDRDARSPSVPVASKRPASSEGPKSALIQSRGKVSAEPPLPHKSSAAARPSETGGKIGATKKSISPQVKSPAQTGFIFKSLPVKRKIIGASASASIAAPSNRPPSSSPAAGLNTEPSKQPKADRVSPESCAPDLKKSRQMGANKGRSLERTGGGVSKASAALAAKTVPKNALSNGPRTKNTTHPAPSSPPPRRSKESLPVPASLPSSTVNKRNDPDSPLPRTRDSLKVPPSLKRKSDIAEQSPRQPKVRKTATTGAGNNARDQSQSPLPVEISAPRARPMEKKLISLSEAVARKTPVSAPAPSPLSSSSRSSPVHSAGSTFSKNLKSSATSMSSSVTSDDSITIGSSGAIAAANRSGAGNSGRDGGAATGTAHSGRKSEIDRAEAFRVKYDAYKHYYSRLQAKEKPTVEEMDRLKDMENQLRRMKEQIWAAAEKGSAVSGRVRR